MARKRVTKHQDKSLRWMNVHVQHEEMETEEVRTPRQFLGEETASRGRTKSTSSFQYCIGGRVGEMDRDLKKAVSLSNMQCHSEHRHSWAHPGMGINCLIHYIHVEGLTRRTAKGQQK